MSHYYQNSSNSYHTQSPIDYSKLDLDMDPLEIATSNDDYEPRRFSFSEENRRWSVLEKVNRNYGHYQLKDATACGKLVNRRCILATSMLAIFVTSIILFFKVILFNINLAPVTYDFIIVGGGPAGCIIAKKLSNAGAKILLLEAGDAPHLTRVGGSSNSNNIGGSTTPVLPSVSPFDIPVLWSSISALSDLQWDELKQSNILSAKALGGNSIFGAMIYLRALASDIRNWNLPALTWSKLLDTYLLQEQYHPIKDSVSESGGYHGKSGYIAVSENIVHDEFSRIFLETSINSGIFNYNPDFNDPDFARQGVGYYQFSILHGLRSTIVNSLIQPYIGELTTATNNHNRKLTIQLNCKVKKLLMEKFDESSSHDDDRYKAYGVVYESKGQLVTATLGAGTRSLISVVSYSSSKNIIPWKRSIILSAGSIMTPALLMASGIGSCKTTQGPAMKICNENIGRNLQDHPSIFLSFKVTDKLESSFPSAFELPQSWINYLSTISKFQSEYGDDELLSGLDETIRLQQLGYVGTPGFSVGGFISSPYSSDSKTPDIQFTVFPSMSMLKPFSPKVRDYMESDNLPETTPTIVISLLQPEISYEVKVSFTDHNNVTSTITNVVPILNSDTERYQGLSEKDLNTFLWGLAKLREVFAATPLKEVVEEEIYPGKNISTDALKLWIAHHHFTMGNWVGSASMGNDALNPVDPEFRLKGVRGLAVADASVIPRVPSGNIQATVAAIASIAADIILSDKP